MNFDWYPFFVVAYRRDTYHLTPEQDGIYRRLIDEYMMSRKSLPADDAALAGIARVSLEDWRRVSEVVRAFFRLRRGRLFHKRCERELRAQNMLQKRHSERAKKGGQANAFRIKTLKSFRSLIPATRQDKEITSSECVARGTSEEDWKKRARVKLIKGN